MSPAAESLRRAVEYGLKHGKGNVLADVKDMKELFDAHDDLFRELAHLVRLLEPLERDGRLDVPGLATLNGARAVLAKAKGE